MLKYKTSKRIPVVESKLPHPFRSIERDQGLRKANELIHYTADSKGFFLFLLQAIMQQVTFMVF